MKSEAFNQEVLAPGSARNQSLTAQLSVPERRDRGQALFQEHEAQPGTWGRLGCRVEGLAEARNIEHISTTAVRKPQGFSKTFPLTPAIPKASQN